ncbi:MAG: succinate dehydrogenase iron-sulfur subunit [Planctomycetota bacterium]|jgi:succinate dehydrogenase / fumarate reductase iron-sulfur subunit
MNIIFSILRFNPQSGKEPAYQDFEVSVKPSDRLLEVLVYIKRNLDNTLSFRRSCAHGVCGSDAMTINGVERLACTTRGQEVVEADGDNVPIKPLKSRPVQRDLMVDYTRFFEVYRLVKPFLIPIQKPDEKENIQSPEDRKQFDDPTKCILCASCYASCPVVAETDPEFIGPAAVVQAARFVFDSRDQGLKPRKDVLDDEHGVWACDGHFNCTKVCPRGIKVTKNINLIKRKFKKDKEQAH